MDEYIVAIENYCNSHNLHHRFVGGVSWGGLLTERSTYTIDIKNKTIHLENHATLTPKRKDGSMRDIDVIFFCNDKAKIKAFKQFIRDLLKQHHVNPLISTEATIYPSIGKRNKAAQMVTALECTKDVAYGKGELYLAFDTITQQISWQTVEPWTVILSSGLTYTVRNPIADFYAYQFRSPGGIKAKDRKKMIPLEKLKKAVEAAGHRVRPGIDYTANEWYGSWDSYLKKLNNSPDLRIKFKKQILNLYWNSIGTTLAHGKGFLGKITLGVSNQFTGVQQ